MKKLMIVYCLLMIGGRCLLANNPVREAAVESFVELVPQDSLGMLGDDVGLVIRDFQEEINRRPPQGLVGWLVAILGLLSSVVAAGRKHWGWMKRLFSNWKGDSVVYLIAIIAGFAWSAFDLQVTGEEVVSKSGMVFAFAVAVYKAFSNLPGFFKNLFNRNKESTPVSQ